MCVLCVCGREGGVNNCTCMWDYVCAYIYGLGTFSVAII